MGLSDGLGGRGLRRGGSRGAAGSHAAEARSRGAEADSPGAEAGSRAAGCHTPGAQSTQDGQEVDTPPVADILLALDSRTGTQVADNARSQELVDMQTEDIQDTHRMVQVEDMRRDIRQASLEAIYSCYVLVRLAATQA